MHIEDDALLGDLESAALVPIPAEQATTDAARGARVRPVATKTAGSFHHG